MSHLDELNPRQREAATHLDGPLLIVAGAGAGKTKTLTHRIISLIESGVAPSAILAITFTNKAASEMRDRVTRATAHLTQDGSTGTPFVSTFHSLGVHILRAHGESLGIPRSFSILDRSDQTSLVKQVLRTLSLDPKVHEPRKVINMISHAKNNLQNPEDASGGGYGTRGYFPQIWHDYQKLCHERNSLDFDDLIVRTIELLDGYPDIRSYYLDRYRYIHVDEYQDTNHAQYRLVRLLVGPQEQLCVVGDADQNIYGWRGANIKNMLNFERDFPNATTVLLEQNYRSTQTILAAANDAIKRNTLRIEKNLFTENPAGDMIQLYSAYDQNDEARFIAQKARTLIDDGVAPSDIAVLYRTNFQSRALEDAFLRLGVPYQVLGVRFFERKEVKDVISYLSLARNPKSIHDFTRVINTPTRGIGKVTVDRILHGKEGELTPAMQKRVESFRSIMRNIRTALESKIASEAIRHLIEVSGLRDSFAHSDDDDAERLANIEELASLATKYDHLPAPEGIDALLTEASLQMDQDTFKGADDTVKLMTVHAAKGLEFPTVFITGLEQELFPSSRPDDPRGSREADEEERRLFYVALTRAMQQVFLTHASMRTIYGQQRMQIPSEFITEMSPEHISSDTSIMPSDSRDTQGEKIVYLDIDL